MRVKHLSLPKDIILFGGPIDKCGSQAIAKPTLRRNLLTFK